MEGAPDAGRVLSYRKQVGVRVQTVKDDGQLGEIIALTVATTVSQPWFAVKVDAATAKRGDVLTQNCGGFTTREAAETAISMMVARISKGTCSGPVDLTREDRAFALGAGSIDDLRVQLLQAAYSDRHGGDWARGIRMTPHGTWRATYRGGGNSKKAVVSLQCVSKEVAQELRDACCIIMGDRRDTLGRFYTAAGQAAIVAKHGLRIFTNMKYNHYRPKKLSATLAELYESAGVTADVPGDEEDAEQLPVELAVVRARLKTMEARGAERTRHVMATLLEGQHRRNKVRKRGREARSSSGKQVPSCKRARVGRQQQEDSEEEEEEANCADSDDDSEVGSELWADASDEDESSAASDSEAEDADRSPPECTGSPDRVLAARRAAVDALNTASASERLEHPAGAPSSRSTHAGAKGAKTSSPATSASRAHLKRAAAGAGSARSRLDEKIVLASATPRNVRGVGAAPNHQSKTQRRGTGAENEGSTGAQLRPGTSPWTQPDSASARGTSYPAPVNAVPTAPARPALAQLTRSTSSLQLHSSRVQPSPHQLQPARPGASAAGQAAPFPAALNTPDAAAASCDEQLAQKMPASLKMSPRAQRIYDEGVLSGWKAAPKQAGRSAPSRQPATLPPITPAGPPAPAGLPDLLPGGSAQFKASPAADGKPSGGAQPPGAGPAAAAAPGDPPSGNETGGAQEMLRRPWPCGGGLQLGPPPGRSVLHSLSADDAQPSTALPPLPPTAPSTPQRPSGPAKLGVLRGIRRVTGDIQQCRILLEASAPEAAEAPEVVQLRQKLEELEVSLSAAKRALGSRGLGAADEAMALPGGASRPVPAAGGGRPRDMAILAQLTPAVRQLVSDHIREVNWSDMVDFLILKAKTRTVEHAAALVERHVASQVLGLRQQEIRGFISAAEKAYEAQLEAAG